MNSDSISESVSNLLAIYRELVTDRRVNWATARQGLTLLISDLSESYPNHPSINTIERFIGEFDSQSVLPN